MPSHSALGAPITPASPKKRSWRRSAWITLVCLGTGMVMFGFQASSFEDLHGAPLPSHYNQLLVLDFLVGLVCIAVVGPMHRVGRWNYLLIAAFAVSASASGAAAVALVRLGTRRSRTDTVLATVLVIVAGLINAWIADDPDFPTEAAVAAPVVGIAALGFISWGRSRADRAALVESLQREAEGARRENAALERSHAALELSRQADVARVRAEERAALARDMHDSLSHHLSLIAMHAGALSFREDLTPEQVRATAQTLRDAAGEANTELASLLNTLREPNESTRDTDPLPEGRSFDSLIEGHRKLGRRIEFSYQAMDSTDLDAFSGATRAALFRIVSELIVNAQKYAADEKLTMTMGHIENVLVIRASNPLRSSADSAESLGTGTGLVGVRERVRLLNGYFARNDSNGQFTVEVHIPWHSR